MKTGHTSIESGKADSTPYTYASKMPDAHAYSLSYNTYIKKAAIFICRISLAILIQHKKQIIFMQYYTAVKLLF